MQQSAKTAGLIGAVCLALAAAAVENDVSAGLRLLQDGRDVEAFRVFLGVPGAEHLAARTGRPKAELFLARLADPPADVSPARVRLIEGDLRLAQGSNAAALACYRFAAAHWPDDAYPVEPTRPGDPAQGIFYATDNARLRPFEIGPGSHRDNWLIRRFLALEAWDDAAREFGRIRAVHQAEARPHVQETVWPGQPARTNRVAVSPCGFSSLALQFALDHAFFLKQRGDTNAALDVLLEPLLVMDMDRLPKGREEPLAAGQESPLPVRNAPLGFSWFNHAASAGFSRKEFIRLACGEFKIAGREADLDAAIRKQIDVGENRARRVLARIRMHQGRMDEAVALELAYVESGRFDPLSAAIRRGRACEDAGRQADAAGAYEQALTRPYAAPALPDADEEVLQNSQMMSAMPRSLLPDGRESHQSQEAVQRDLLERLQRLYAALGKSDRALSVSLRLLEVSDRGMDDLANLERAVNRFRTAGREQEIQEWLADRADKAVKPGARANICWVLGDQDRAVRAIAELAAPRPEQARDYAVEVWKERFRNAGNEPYRRLLEALVAANPRDMQTQLEWLDARGRLDEADVIPVLEQLLESDALPAFPRGKGARNRTHFRNYADLTYRLLRLYERCPGQGEKIVPLGFRMLEGKQNPFVLKPSALADYRSNWNDSIHSDAQVVSDTLRGLQVFLAHLKKPADVERAAALIKESGCIPLINQVNRLLTDAPRPRIDPASDHRSAPEKVAIRTLGLPAGVRLLTNRDDVRAIAPGAQWDDHGGRAWIGTSWGLVRYRESGGALEILQLPTGAGVLTFCEYAGGLYAGTRDGLLRLEDPWGDNPKVVRIGVETADGRTRDRVERTMERSGETRTDRIHEAFPVNRLLVWRGALWVCSNGDLYRYDAGKRETQYFGHPAELLCEGCGKLWGAQSVYDPAAGEFMPIETGQRQWHIIGATGNEVWADVYVNDRLRHRPAIIHPDALDFTILPIPGLPRSEEQQNNDFRLLGESDGLVWLAGGSTGLLLTYDRGKKELKKTTGPVPSALPGSADNSPADALAAVKLRLQGDRGPNYSCVPLANGRLLVGASIVREWQEDNLGFDDNTGMSHHVQDLEGGLFLVDPAAGTWRKLGTPAEELCDFYVKRCVRDGDRLYVCSNGGVTILALPEGKVVGRITVSDGLPSNKVEDLARIGDRLYLACELGDDGGGLAVMDLKSGLIQTLSKADGLKCDKIKRLRAEDGRLHILYGSIYSPRAYETPLDDSVPAPVPADVLRRWPASRPDDRVLTFPSSILDTKTGTLGKGGEIQPGAVPPETQRAPLPVLGGWTLASNVEAGVTFLAGTHGLLMISAAASDGLAETALPRENLTVVRSARSRQAEEANRRALDLATAADVGAALGDPNPWYRTRAAAWLLGREKMIAGNVPALIRMLDSPELRERSTALYILSRAPQDSAILDAYGRVLKDRNASIRGLATILLCRNGRIPDSARLREIVSGDHSYGNYPFNVASSVGVEVDREHLYAALAPRATAPIFALLLESPPPVSDYPPQVDVLKQLGASLNAQPDAADVLLAAYDEPNTGERTRFAAAVFGYAGAAQLPRLHAALASKDRIVRSNAARACGAIRAPSSIPHLIRALNLESGLARASIVAALGTLQAREALPRLTELYIDAQNDEKRRSGSGFMAQQALAVQRAQYDSLRSLDALSSDWNELREAALAPPVDPRRGEKLLSPEIIRDAVAQIDTSAARDFYRMLAGGKDVDGRAEAALRLASGAPADREDNAAILKNLLADGDARVEIAAAVSLLLLGEEVARRPLLARLEGGDPWVKGRVIVELGRVKDPARIEFARAAIQAFASDERQSRDMRQAAEALLRGDR